MAQVELRDCPSCGSSHMGPVPCGLTFGERMRSVKTATEWMPSVSDSRARGERVYYDDEHIKPMFGGLDRKERREQMMEETKGFGPIYEDTPYNPEHEKAIFGEALEEV